MRHVLRALENADQQLQFRECLDLSIGVDLADKPRGFCIVDITAGR